MQSAATQSHTPTSIDPFGQMISQHVTECLKQQNPPHSSTSFTLLQISVLNEHPLLCSHLFKDILQKSLGLHFVLL